MLPSGPGGVRHFPSRGAQPSTPSHTAHSTRAPLKGEFNPAVADCGLQGTATSPSSTAKSKMAEGVGFEPTVQLPVHGISSAAPSATRPPLRVRILAEGRGFEPPRDLRPYPISSRTPSTGLGHPSATDINYLTRFFTLASTGSSMNSKFNPSSKRLHPAGLAPAALRPTEDAPEPGANNAAPCSTSSSRPAPVLYEGPLPPLPGATRMCAEDRAR